MPGPERQRANEPAYQLPARVMALVFHYEPPHEGREGFFWQDSLMGGYVLVWADGSYMTTEHFPPNIAGLV